LRRVKDIACVSSVISSDLVPIVPYETDSVLINMGQRYDVIVEANAVPGDYWLRSGFIDYCIPNGASKNMTAIVRYKKDSTADPTSVSTMAKIETCLDEPAERVLPWVPVNVPNIKGGITYENVTGEYFQGKFLRWSFNQPSGGFMWTNWSQPALGDVFNDKISSIPKQDNIFAVSVSDQSLRFTAMMNKILKPSYRLRIPPRQERTRLERRTLNGLCSSWTR
jgi:hypothetical protein